jgi:hypothetical protein
MESDVRTYKIEFNSGPVADMVAAMTSMHLDMAAAADPSNPANTVEAEQLEAAYAERNRCLYMALGWAASAGYPCGIKLGPGDGPVWPVLYIELPTGQVSWHMPAYPGEFDGHSTTEKYARVAEFSLKTVIELKPGPFEPVPLTVEDAGCDEDCPHESHSHGESLPTVEPAP